MSKLLRPMDVAERLGIGRSMAYALLRAGVIKSVRIGKRALRVREEDLVAYVAGLG